MPATITVSLPQYTISGKISDIFNLPMSGLIVEAFDKSLRSEQLLNSIGNAVVHTDANGFYKTMFTYLSVPGFEYKTPDVFIRVKDSQGKLIGQSDIKFNIQTEDTISLQVNSTDEFTRLLQIILPITVTAGVTNIKDLQENDKHKDISFIAAETGISADTISAFVRAYQLADEANQKLIASNTNISSTTSANTSRTSFTVPLNFSPVFFYALLRKGFSNELSAILRTADKELQKAILKAIEENIVPANTGDSLETSLKAMHRLLYHEVIAGSGSAIIGIDLPLKDNPILKEYYYKVKAVSYGQLISLPDSTINRLSEQPTDIDDIDEASLQKMMKEGTISAMEKTALTTVIDFSRLSGENLQLVTALHNANATVDSLIDYDIPEWKNFLVTNRIPLPDGEKSVDEYAKSLASNLELSFPQKFFLNRIITKKDLSVSLNSIDVISKTNLIGGLEYNGNKILADNLNWNGISEEDRKNLELEITQLQEFANTYRYLGITGILAKQDTGIDEKKEIVNKRLDQLKTFYANNAQVDFSHLDFFEPEIQLNYTEVDEENKPLIKAQAMAFQRMLIVGRNATTAQTLLAKGFSSSRDIIDIGEQRFVEILTLELNEAKSIYDKALDNVMATSHFFQAIRDAQKGGFNSLAVNNLKTFRNDLRQIDGYQLLFGKQDFCDCEHCRSVFSQAAYFTDLMLFVEKNVTQKVPQFAAATSEHPLKLKNRRPDLWTLPLTCQNTTSEIPYLDVVNDVLEQYINSGLENQNVYEVLSESVLSCNLPFNLPLAEVRTYLGHFDFSLSQVYKILNEDEYKQAQEALHISDKELFIIVTPKPENALVRFGNPSDINTLSVPEFIRFANISRSDLEALLSVKSNGEISKVKIEVIESSEGIQQYTEVFRANSLTKGRLDIIQRFLKLWKKTGWTMQEFDMLMLALHDSGLVVYMEEKDEHGHYKILVLSDIIKIQEDLKLNVEELCSIIHEIPEDALYANTKGLYERLFNLKEIFGTETIVNLTAELTPYLLAGLSISEHELNLLLSLLGINDAPVSLNKNIVSRLYRQSRLASGLKLSIENFVASANISVGGEEIKSVQGVIELVENKKWIETTPFSFQNLDFIINGVENTGNRYSIDQEKGKAIVSEIQIAASSSGTSKTDLLKNKIQSIFNISGAALTEDILKFTTININDQSVTDALNSDLVDLSALSPIVLILNELERKIFCLNKLRWKDNDTLFFLSNSTVFGISDIKNWSLENVRTIVTYTNLLINISEETKTEIRQVLRTIAEDNSVAESGVMLFASLWSCSSALVQSVINIFSLAGTPIDSVNRLHNLLLVSQTLGIQAESLIKLTKSDYPGLTEANNIVYGAFASKYPDEQTRGEMLEAYHDKLNTLKRDALCDYIIAQRDIFKFNDRADLYYFFLLDVEMSGCFRTSKLLAAISSVQLYIHRCLLNLEQSDDNLNPDIPNIKVRPDLIPADEWEWQKNYRVWEANRKVFLYPENYIVPDLRDTKTPLFKELEDELLQQNVTLETAEASYKKYLAQFLELASLRYAGAYYYHVDNNPVSQIQVPVSVLPNTMKTTRLSAGNVLMFKNVIVDEEKTIYYLFAKTNLQPFQYYYRTFNQFNNLWGHWQKIDLPIEAEEVSTIIHNGLLHIYWTDVQHKEVTNISGGDATSENVIFKVSTKYSHLDANGKWAAPQSLYLGRVTKSYQDIFGRLNIIFDPKENNKDSIIEKYKLKVFRKPYISKTSSTEELELRHIYSYGENLNKVIYKTIPLGDFPSFVFEVTNGNFNDVPEQSILLSTSFKIKLYSAIEAWVHLENLPGKLLLLDVEIGPPFEPVIITSYRHNVHQYIKEPNLFFDAVPENIQSNSLYKEFFSAYRDDGNYVHYVEDGNKDFVIGDKSVSQISQGQAHLRISANSGLSGLKELSTILSDDLNAILSETGLQNFLSLQTQNTCNTNGQQLNFNGSYGTYYWEMFFHIPFLIANHLNANQDFKGAKWWYERIFNPTSSERPLVDNPGEHYWQFREFRNLDIIRLKDILSDESAIAVYKKDPFDPHAIATLRISAYQKAIVMKYIDNLLDWGDSLFTQDTQESLVEADMLYQLARDILGKRPEKTGKCKTADEEELTFEKIASTIDDGSEFLINLENVVATIRNLNKNDKAVVENSKYLSKLLENLGNSNATPNKLSDLAILSTAKYNADLKNLPGSTIPDHRISNNGQRSQILKYSLVKKLNYTPLLYTGKIYTDTNDPQNKIIYDYEKINPAKDVTDQSKMAFCVPVNEDLLQYWDRVEDRLFKIRNCMNISGIRRSLALYQPPIDPMLLVRAKAAGLSLEEILAGVTGITGLPNYRFAYMLEKAKQFAQNVQGFGAALLSALEKKDGEELTLLRSVHERNVLQLTKDIKNRQVNEAEKQYQALEETLINIENRIEYYQGLIDEGLTGWEKTEQVTKHTATSLKISEGVLHLLAGLTYLIPQVGNPFSMKYGGKELGDSGNEYAQWSSSIAGILDSISASAGLEASFQRRKEEWNFQLKTAMQDLKQSTIQLLAADVRLKIAERDQEIHEKTIEQSAEVHEFFLGKFTNIGLYNYMATSLSRLYRMTYTMASEMAKQAEQCYKLESFDEAIFIENDNWQNDMAGLLSGERLLLQLQRMEKAFMDQNVRQQEITQSFSLFQINPAALLKLRQTGNFGDQSLVENEVWIPEIAFDLLYPGQYQRVIKSVRISIPCVAGPYTNISAKLTLKDSLIRKSDKLNMDTLTSLANGRQIAKDTSITTSSSQNDGGVFELNFRDERYLPFEGAGAVSRWQLELPGVVRSFNYNTISDVIFHIGYTAKDDAIFRTTVENQLRNNFMEVASTGLYRLLSLKNDFGDEFYKLLNNDPHLTEFDVSNDFFPYFLIDKELSMNEVKVYLKPKRNMAVTVPSTMTINEANPVTWNSAEDISVNGDASENDKIKTGTVSLTGSPLQKWKIDAGVNGINKDKVDDILVLIKYRIL
jgi:hypothetical protein